MGVYKHVEYICSYCGAKITRTIISGRPLPGNCSRKSRTKDGKMRPHTWIINKKF